MTYANPNAAALTSARKPAIECAEQYAGYARDGLHRLLVKVRIHFEPVFGHVIAETLVPELEAGFENATEAFQHFRDAVDERHDRLVESQMTMRALQEQHAVLLQLLRIGAEETAARFAKARKAPPEWVGTALGLTRGPQAQAEPF